MFLTELTFKVTTTCGMNPDVFNYIIFNLNEHQNQSVYWHKDDEDLFGNANNQDISILSLSLGRTRNFEFSPEGHGPATISVPLGHGDLLAMEGMCQKHLYHRVPKIRGNCGPRINLTWRRIRHHEEQCPCFKGPESAS